LIKLEKHLKIETGYTLKNSKIPRIICIIPARQGSKGLRQKNLRLVGGFTLVNRAIRVARSIEEPVYIILSSDCELILTKYKKKVDKCIKRKTELSTDNSLITDVIKDALQDLTDFHDEDIVMLLEPSSPNRTTSDLSNSIRVMVERNYSSITTVSLVDTKYHPYKLLKSTHNSHLTPFLTDSPIISNRQEIKEQAFYRNGLVYLYRLSIAKKLDKSLPNETNFIVTNRKVSNIDNIFDLWLARYFDLRRFFKL